VEPLNNNVHGGLTKNLTKHFSIAVVPFQASTNIQLLQILSTILVFAVFVVLLVRVKWYLSDLHFPDD
jgi:hypothetical protein